ncbi:MAG: phage tail sheath family protein [Aestuariibacter sp.]|nr:phage tail sheath family protein [Aestuariibacter sp.]
MSTYPLPDVYPQEIFPVVPPRFLTGVPVFLGYADSGPVNEPVLVHLWPQFVATFGTSFSGGYLAQAVQGFFENGGQVGYVLRLDDDALLTSTKHLQEGLTAVSILENIDLICTPDIVREATLDGVVALQQAVLDHCKLMGDRFAILDTPKEASRETVLEQKDALNSSFGALYHPWLTIADYTDPVPPCGHIAGIYARSDQRVGVHKAPGNEVVNGVLALATELSKTDQTVLFANNVNFLRPITGRGIHVWGVRTLSDDPTWQYINVRRLLITVGRWLEQFMMRLSFEPNDIYLWTRIVREVTAYLTKVYQRGALKGPSPEYAFYVKCDSETNPPAVRDTGQVVTNIGLAAAVPGEFIDVRVVGDSSGIAISEQ